MHDNREEEIESRKRRIVLRKGEKQVMKKHKGSFGRIAARVVTFAMLTGLLPGQALIVRADPAQTAPEKHNTDVTSVGVSGIGNPQVANSDRTPWRGNYVYYGGHKFRVLDTDTTDFSEDNGILPQKHTMLLDSDSVLNEHIHFDNDGKPNEGAERANEWEYSDLKTWLNDPNNGFLKAFSKAEIKGIASSTKPDPVNGDGKGFPNMRYAPLKDDNVFVLDAVEASRRDYGYRPSSGAVTTVDNSFSRVKIGDSNYNSLPWYELESGHYNEYYSGIWWLRSPFYSPRYQNYGGFVFGVSTTFGGSFNEGGYFATNDVSFGNPGPSPALNVDLDSVLLSTKVKNSDLGYGKEYKLTLVCDGIETAITPEESVSIAGNTVTVPFTVTDKDPDDGITADCVSVLVTRGDRTNGAITKYEKVASLNPGDGASGTKSFELPEGYNSSTDHIYIFAEDTREGNKLTDYASAPLELMQPGAASDLCYDGTDKNLLNNTDTIPDGYNVQYALSETESEPDEGSYSTDIPKAKDAGTYRIWYKMTKDSSVIGPNSMIVTIAKKRVGVSEVTASDKQYDGERNVTLSGGTLNSSDIISEDDISIASLEGRFKYSDAGDNKPVTITKITLKGSDKGNYAPYADQNSLTAKVTQKPVTVTGITAEDKEYDGTNTATLNRGAASITGVVDCDLSVYNGVTVSKNTVGLFEDAALGTDKTVNLQIKVAGYSGANYCLGEGSQKTATAKITPRSITIRAKDQNVGLGDTIDSGVDDVSIVNGSLIEGHSISAVTLTPSSTDALTDNGTITPESIVIMDADGSIVTGNYSITPQNGVLTVTNMNKAKITAEPVGAGGLIYSGKEHSLLSSAGTADTAMEYCVKEILDPSDPPAAPKISSEYAGTVPKKIAAGDYRVFYRAKKSAGLSSGVVAYLDVTIGKADSVAAVVTANNRTYDGTEKPLVTVNGEATGGEMQYALGTDATTAPTTGWSTSIPTAAVAGTYYVWYRAGGDKNHNDSQAECLKVIINEASQPEPVVRKSIKNATVTDVVNKTYTGKAQTQKPKVVVDGMTLTEGRDYTLSYINNIKVGTATMTITGIGDYEGTENVLFKILTAKQAKDMKNATVSGIAQKTYTGKAITQSFIVNLGGKDLKQKTDYTVTYKNNKNVGTATITIKGTGKKYNGTLTKTFKIIKADNPLKVSGVKKAIKLKASDLKKKAATLKVSKVIKTSKAGQGTVTYKKKSGSKSVSIDKKTGTVTVAKDTPAGDYKITVSVTASGNKNYNKAVKTASFTIKVS